MRLLILFVGVFFGVPLGYFFSGIRGEMIERKRDEFARTVVEFATVAEDGSYVVRSPFAFAHLSNELWACHKAGIGAEIVTRTVEIKEDWEPYNRK